MGYENRGDCDADTAQVELDRLWADGNAWTWMDGDPTVAFNDPESFHGRLVAILETVGWERCYHRGSQLLHFNVKLNGHDAYKAFHDAIAELQPNGDHDRIVAIHGELEEWRLTDWWQIVVEDFDGQNSIWSGGRAGGWLCVSERYVTNHQSTMVDLATHCVVSREWFNSAAYGREAAMEAIGQYRDEKMVELASPRSERVEA